MLNNWIHLCTRCTSAFSPSQITARALQGEFQCRRRMSPAATRSFNCPQQQHFSSKSPPSESAVVLKTVESEISAQSSTASSLGTLPTTSRSTTSRKFVPHFSDKDIREVDDETRAKIHNMSTEIASAQSSSLVNPDHIWRRKEIMVMEESEWNDSYVLKVRPPFIDRVKEGNSFFFRRSGPEEINHIDNMTYLQQDIDLRLRNVKRIVAKHVTRGEIMSQEYITERNRILGNELAAAHFIVCRKGKVKFLGQNEWVSEYRKDAKPGLEEEDLPIMRMDLCTLPVHYDPRYRVEAIDASGVNLHYEGLKNFENLQYVKALILRESKFIDDWCVERIARIFGETLEYIDLSGCRLLTDRGIGVLHRCRNLKVICLDNLSHLDNLEIVCAMLEDHNPKLEILGIDYEAKKEKLKLEGEKYERMALYEKDIVELEPLDTEFKAKQLTSLQKLHGGFPTLKELREIEAEDRKLLLDKGSSVSSKEVV